MIKRAKLWVLVNIPPGVTIPTRRSANYEPQRSRSERMLRATSLGSNGIGPINFAICLNVR